MCKHFFIGELIHHKNFLYSEKNCDRKNKTIYTMHNITFN